MPRAPLADQDLRILAHTNLATDRVACWPYLSQWRKDDAGTGSRDPLEAPEEVFESSLNSKAQQHQKPYEVDQKCVDVKRKVVQVIQAGDSHS